MIDLYFIDKNGDNSNGENHGNNHYCIDNYRRKFAKNLLQSNSSTFGRDLNKLVLIFPKI